MAETTIEWTSYQRPDGSWTPGYTFNAWRGCTKVSPGCAHCYADTMSKRNPSVLGVWGRNGTRVIAAESYWRGPLKWDREAAQAGERRRVFCASLADVFEGPETMPESEWPKVEAARVRLWELIEATPHLDWLLLTKRPQNAWQDAYTPITWWDAFPPNIWIGTSVEDQAAADERIPHLLRVPARVRFLSCEPLLGPVDLGRTEIAASDAIDSEWRDGRRGNPIVNVLGNLEEGEAPGIHWVIVGGESGGSARPMHPDWARSLRDQCQAAGVAFHFKQCGEYVEAALRMEHPDAAPYVFSDGTLVMRVGKKAAGRQLDGRTWDEFPA